MSCFEIDPVLLYGSCCSNCSNFGHWEPFQLASVSFDKLSHYVLFCFCCIYLFACLFWKKFPSFLTLQHALAPSYIFSALGLESDILVSGSWFFVWDGGKIKVWAMWLWLLGCCWLEALLADRARKYMYVYTNTMYVHISINTSVCQHLYLF